MSNWLEKFKAKPMWLSLSLAGGLLIIVGVFSVVVISSRTEEKLIVQKASEIDELEGKLVVDVSGAVVQSGVYELKVDARVNEALIAAGGLGEKADRDWIEKNLNLAAKVKDGQKIYIPNKDSPSFNKGESFVNINTASATELDTLYGVGEVTAKKIIDNRPYGAVEELLTKKVVSNKVYEAIKDQITVY